MLNEYYNEVRHFIESNQETTSYGGQLFFYEIGEDEIYDPSLASLRAYGNRIHSDIIRLACGVSFSFEPLPQKTIILPNLSILLALQKKHGVVNGR